MIRALRHLTLAAALVAAVACGSTSSTTVAGPSPAKCQLTATNNTPNFTASGGQGDILVAAARECAWTAAAQVSWVALIPPMNGQGDSTLKYSVQTNPSGLPRRGTVNVAGQIVELGQEGAACRFELDRSRAQIAAEAGSIDVTVQGPAGCGWTAVSEVPWITVTQGAQGNGAGRATLRATGNAGAARVGTVVIAGVRFELTQVAAVGPPPAPPDPPAPPGPPSPPPPPGCTYGLLPSSAQFDASATEGTVSLVTGTECTWVAAVNQSWLSIVSTTSGTGSAQITYRVTANDTGATRSGQLTVGTAVFSVQQAAAGAPPPPACTFDVSPRGSIDANAAGTTGTITVNTASTCAWTAVTPDSWIAVAPAAGSGSGGVTYTVAPNAGSSGRSGSIVVAGTTITVTQQGSPGQPITLSGEIANLSGSCPAVTFTLDRRTVRTSGATTYKGGNCPKLRNGDTVVVRGTLNTEGTVDATEVEFTK